MCTSDRAKIEIETLSGKDEDFSGSDQLCGESVSLLIRFLCLGFANIVFCKDGEPPVGVLHKEASFTSSNRRC